METRLTWDEAERAVNLRKHGLDFVDAGEVLDSRYRMDVPVLRAGEPRLQSFAYVMRRLRVLTVVHTDARQQRARHQLPPGKRAGNGDLPWLAQQRR